ncbi:IS30 family transposase [Paraburkholderia sp. Clong3]|uniref:hypothetical protein n=1 Tax=Paraburkholderia sp. Clong3 TaxID=2991061 RepID=UPI003D207579
MQLLDLHDLAALLKRAPHTIKRDLRRNPLAVPPRLPRFDAAMTTEASDRAWGSRSG